MSDIKDCLLDSLDCVLSVREDMGAQLADSFLITRTWSGSRVGDGTFKDTSTPLSPAPEIVDLSHDLRVQMNGTYKSGDLILKSISQKKYSEDDLRTDTGVKNVEKFIKVGPHFYRTVHVRQRLVTWDLHITKVSQDETERR